MENVTAHQTNSPGRRAAAYWFIDGLPEILFGAALLLWGATALFVPQPWTRWIAGTAAMLFLIVYIKHRGILESLKARLTYPRTGYVRPPVDPPQPPGWDTLTIATAPPYEEDGNFTWFRVRTVMMLFCAAQAAGLIGTSWGIAAVMAACALVLHLLNRGGEHPYGWLSLVVLALSGLPFAFMRLPEHAVKSIPMAIGGFWLLAHGALALMRYLRANPRPVEMA